MYARRFGLGLVIGGLLFAGCAGNDTSASGSAAEASAQPATAWWKTEGQEAASTTAAGLSGGAQPGWAKLAAIDAGAAAGGAKLFDSKGCAACHSIGSGTKVGPDLQGVTHRIAPDWMNTWLANPEPMLDKDPHAKEMLTKYLVKMPNLQLTPDEIHRLSEYFRQQDLAAETIAKGAHT
jgi:mono/diheme cytochrome c family protein